MGMFITFQIDQDHLSAADRKHCVEVCPVDIFCLQDDGQLATQLDNEDECTLCELCLQASPPGALSIIKLYEGTP